MCTTESGTLAANPGSKMLTAVYPICLKKIDRLRVKFNIQWLARSSRCEARNGFPVCFPASLLPSRQRRCLNHWFWQTGLHFEAIAAIHLQPIFHLIH